MTHIANSFFHYTEKSEYLISILENDFYPRYCYEDYKQLLPNYANTNTSTEVAVPMVCFCDIPLTLVSEHAKEYGSYAIGLSKEWGLSNLSPVFYLTTNSIPHKKLHQLQKYVLLEQNVSEKELYERFEALQDFFGFIKPYTGISHKNKKPKDFYREREWRWIPEISDSDKKLDVILRLLKEDDEQKETKNRLIKDKYSLKYTMQDINYIVVPSDEEKKKVVQQIYNMKSSKYKSNDILYLISKVISLEEIEANF